MAIAPVRLPRGRQFALTWGIPDDFGGMTAALLHRSRAFVREAGVPVSILTLDDRPDYPDLERRMRADGVLVDGMSLLNLWEWLREHDVRAADSKPRPSATLAPEDSDEVHRSSGVVLSRARTDGSESADRFRRDGSLLATDRRTDGGKRRLVLYDRSGVAVRSWTSTWGLYRHWLDSLTAKKRSFLIVDSKTAARFVHTYRRSSVVTIHVLHGSHRKRGSADHVSDSRRETFENAADYDAIVTLTRRQATDYRADGARPRQLFVVPNGLASDRRSAQANDERVRGRGIMLASLTGRKRVAHAVDAIAAARAAGGDVTLDVFGEGPKHDSLAARIADAGLEGFVHLNGFERDAAARFADADFTVLTSTSEGLPLVLVESMAAGCIPIAYDICYGPGDIITNGRDGYLVPEGDVAALAERILTLRSLSPRRLAAMRRRARRTARRFRDDAVTRRWGRVMELALEHKRDGAVETGNAIHRVRRRLGRVKRRAIRLLGR